MNKEVIIHIENPKDNDLISRQAVLNLIADYDLSMGQVVKGIHALPPVPPKPETVTEFADRCRECGARYGKLLKQKDEAIDIAIKAIEQTTWIPVSERLPEDGTYLVTVEGIDGEPRIDIRSFANDLNKVDEFDFPKHKCGWYDYDSEYGFWEDTRVTAWMPLPKPYEPQESEE